MSERGHALLSASSAYRWLECPPSAVAARAYKEEPSEFAAEGTLAHAVAEAVVRGDKLPENEAKDGVHEGVTREMIDNAFYYRDYILEQKQGPNAVQLLEQRVDFSGWVPKGFGTCDCILIGGNTLIIIDYKYGVGVPVSAVGNPQMRLYALGALHDFGFAYDVERIITHIFQPRIDNVSTEELTTAELLEWAKTIKPIAEKAAKGKGKYKPGAHCKFCPHAGRCRSLTNKCKAYVEINSLRIAVPVLAPHEVAEVLAMEPLIALWLKKIKSQALNDMMDGKEVPGYKVVEGKQGNRKWTDEFKVTEALECAGYSREDYTEIKLLSPASIDKLLGKKKAAELLESLTDRAAGSPTIAKATDKRPAYNRLAEAQDDFR